MGKPEEALGWQWGSGALGGSLQSQNTIGLKSPRGQKVGEVG